MAKMTTVSTHTNGDPYELKIQVELDASFELSHLLLVHKSTVTLNAKKLDGKLAFELQQKLDEVLRKTINEFFKER